jgi:hypothetical protein|tara:strand:- start:345 stop:1160 length:816 start_codon:yes stop_codon:yes gene_type:complete
MDNIIKGLLDSLELSDGVTLRQDCPYCGGHNTFTLLKERGEVKWNCYKLDCRIKGRENNALSKADLVADVKKVTTKHEQHLKPLPHWVPPTTKMKHWMHLWGVLRAVEQQRLKAMYDPKENRYVFLAFSEGRLVAAQGRAAYDPTNRIKWKHYYGRVRAPFIIPEMGTYMLPWYKGRKVGICVEDITSAAVVSDYADGIALMGTNLLDDYIPILQKYDLLIICLDKDANIKANSIARELNWYTETKLVISGEDPKNMSKSELDKLFGSVPK